MKECSVIILNWNGEAMLRRYLPSVLQHTSGDGIEVVVADNGSTDTSLDYLKTQPVRIIELGKNYGFAEGYNRAIAEVDARYVVLLNSDVEVTPGWLDTLLIYAHAHAHEGVVALQPKILSWQSWQDAKANGTDKVLFEHAGAAGGMIDCLGYPFCLGRFLSHVEYDEGQYDSPTPIFWASGACLFINREVYMQVGGLDNDFFAHQEEIDLCWRLQSRGYLLYSVPQSVVYHLGGGTLQYNNPKKDFLNFRNNLLMLYKNLPTRKLLPVLFVRFFMDYLAALQMIVSGNLLNAKAVVKARCHFLKLRSIFKNKRINNIRNTKMQNIGTISSRSIVLDFYLRRLRK